MHSSGNTQSYGGWVMESTNRILHLVMVTHHGHHAKFSSSSYKWLECRDHGYEKFGGNGSPTPLGVEVGLPL